MAQIIKHRRGSLESVASATKRAGELLVVTGSAGITATNGNSILFVGIDGSTVTPANKILYGTSVPDLSGASYDTSVDGIPFYDTSAQKLYILNKGGNTEIKATANTGGTGIVSGSSQITPLLPTGTVSGSSQITISSTTGYSTFSSSLDSRLVTISTNVTELFGTASNHEGRIDTIEASIGGGGALATRVTALETFSGSQETKDSTLATYTGSVDTNLTTLNSFSSSINTTIKTKLNVEGVISGSSQVLGGTGIVSSSAQIDALFNIDGLISSSTQLDSTTINALRVTSGELSGSFNGTFVGDGSGITGIASTLAFSGSTGNDTINLKTESLLVTGSTGVSTAVTNNTITISGVDASTSSKGVASFSSTNFAVSSGNVTIKSGGVTAASLAAGVAGTGISLNGVDNSIEVDYGSTAGTAVEGNTSLTVQGTSNEISVSGGSVTLGAGGTVTIGLPDSVTIATASIQNNLSVGGNINVTGNLYVQGTTTTIDSTTIQLGDNIIELNGSNAANGGLLVRDVTAPNNVSGSLLWDTTNDYWKGGALGSEKQFARLNATPTSGSVQVIGASGLLVDSHITDAGTNVTITSDLVINGLTANAFVVSNGSKKLISVAPSNAGDLIQWNGSSFVASNEIDGGTF